MKVKDIFSINIEELQYTVKQFYGGDFNGYQYLDRFFDYRFNLPNADLTEYLDKIGISDTSAYGNM